jgi:hypothetical protein
VRHVVRDAHVVVRRGLHKIARERHLLEEVAVGVVVVVAAQLGVEVAELERLVPGRLDVVKGSARAQVGRGDLGVVREPLPYSHCACGPSDLSGQETNHMNDLPHLNALA